MATVSQGIALVATISHGIAVGGQSHGIAWVATVSQGIALGGHYLSWDSLKW